MKTYLLIGLCVIMGCSAGSNSAVSDMHTNAPNQKKNLSTLEENLHSARIGFYNCENFFDCQDDPNTNDEEFLPDGDMHWTEDRYEKKKAHLAEAISSMMAGEHPACIGLCEIENKKVLEDLLKEPALADYGWEIAHQDSHDPRGIDVALLYDPRLFGTIKYELIEPAYLEAEGGHSRDILHAEAQWVDGSKLHILVNHWPSRREGTEESDRKRAAVARSLRESIEAIQKEDPKAQIICMGDFNDNPEDASIQDVLGADGKEGHLRDLMAGKTEEEGSIQYEGNWMHFDQLIVSANLEDGQGLEAGEADVFRDDKLMYTDRQGHSFPNKTYGGTKYYGGYSDHLPIYLDLHW